MSDDEASPRDEDASAWDRALHKIEEIAASDEMAVAADVSKDLAKKGGRAAGHAYDTTKDAFTQEDAWMATQATISALTEVARAQHAMILDLIDRVSHLESPASPTDPAENAAGD